MVVAVLFNAGDQVPVIKFIEVVGKGDKLPPEQIAGTALNVGVVDAGLTVIVNVAVVAHCPVFGVKVYAVVVVLFKAGDQVPVIPFSEVVGNGDRLCPAQIAVTALNVGMIAGMIVIVVVTIVPHWPALGVKVYTVVVVLFKAGDQVPVIPFSEVVGKAVNGNPEQIGVMVLNVGTMTGLTVITNVAVAAHCPAVGVKV